MECISPYSTLRPGFSIASSSYVVSHGQNTLHISFFSLGYLVYLFNLTNMVFVGVYEWMCMWCVCVDTCVNCVYMCVCMHTCVCVAQRRLLGVLLCHSLSCFLGTGSLINQGSRLAASKHQKSSCLFLSQSAGIIVAQKAIYTHSHISSLTNILSF